MRNKSMKKSNRVLLIGFGITVLLITAFLITGRVILDKYIGPPAEMNHASHITETVCLPPALQLHDAVQL